ncbi:DUF3182 family protein [Bordetella bronchiseptica]|uniref:DUF3182 family protein n=1 Tax=Bordetella bronchiseptica TaxID=518 RepID=UPI000528AD3E|nr:DUF3182 family protein [Bordetella bronchiseptica]
MNPAAAVPRRPVDLVVAHPGRRDAPRHERASLRALGRDIAELLGCEYADALPAAARDPRLRVYYVPTRTLLDGRALALGIQGPDDLFGGVAPHGFVATKAITHALPHDGCAAPAAWSRELGARLSDCVLPGCTVFALDEARQAGVRMLRTGALRVKPVRATAGRGQRKVADAAALDQALAEQDAGEVRRYGLVLEEHLEDISTYSVGVAQVGVHLASYIGTQSLTLDHAGLEVYGGSDLWFVPGPLPALLQLELDAPRRAALEHAMRYDEQAFACYPRLYASRRNYDVARGRDAQGRWRTGVLEQSWRAGGASLAEIAALRAFAQDGGLRRAHAATSEHYGPDPAHPPGTRIVFHAHDAEVGFISKAGGMTQDNGTDDDDT